MPLRLIDVQTHNFANPTRIWAEDKLEYAVLSHRWLAEADEVSFKEIGNPAIAESKNGLFKITGTCELAKKAGLRYAWLDTCCIDKSSSAELQESINSMYRWYAESTVCFVYLKDIDIISNPDPAIIKHDMWFDRGWTLQELIAPKNVEFYDKNWNYVGNKHDLKQHIHERTGISLALLENKAELQEFSVAQRMSWAAHRETTVLENQAYSLFGMFGISLPMLYGERENAFQRLQEEIIRISDDHSIFAWKGVGPHHSGLLARTPKDFSGCGSVRKLRLRNGCSAYKITNRGIEITLNLTPWTLDTYLARIHCNDFAAPSIPNAGLGEMSGIFLRRLGEDDQYARIEIEREDVINHIHNPPKLKDKRAYNSITNSSQDLLVYVRQAIGRDPHLTTECIYGYRICGDLLERNSKGKPLFKFPGPNGITFNEVTRTVTMPRGSPSQGYIATMDISRQGKAICIIRLCFDFGFNPVVYLENAKSVGAIGGRPANPIYDDWIEDTLQKRSLANIPETPELERSELQAYGGKLYAFEDLHRVGLWVLKADRIDGLDVRLFGTEKDNIRVVLEKVKTDQGIIWDFKIENMPSKFWRKLW